jgi:hypothetical protein
MDEMPKRRVWLPSPGLLVAVGIIAILVGIIGVLVGVILIPGLFASNPRSNEWNASSTLKTLAAAEADFRTNDRDGNKVKDFWTGDVSGLYYPQTADTKIPLKLIEQDAADADAKPLFLLPKGTVAKSGYLYYALDRYETIPGPGGEYKVDTDKSGRKVHNEKMFAFYAYPVSSRYGTHQFAVNEGNCVFRELRSPLRTSWPVDTGPGPDWFRDECHD